MSTFEVPSTTCANLDAMTRIFWWNPKNANGHYLAFKSWSRLCQSKEEGGSGLRRNKDFNAALLSKLAWMVASNWDSVCMRLLRSKYKV
jgi:hypothetical protein